MPIQKINRLRNPPTALTGFLNPLAVAFPIYGGIVLYLHLLVLYALAALKARFR